MKNSKLLKKFAKLSMGLSLLLFIPTKAVKAQAVVEIFPHSGSNCMYLNATNDVFEVMVISGSANNFQWYTEGDIRIVSSPNGPIVEVESYTNRSGLNDGPYGKGRLWVTYIDSDISDLCGPQRVYFDICKIFEEPKFNIIGPKCVSEGDTVTYSIRALVSVNLTSEIGIDRYFWNFSTGVVNNLLYYSGDSSSVTFVMGALSGGDFISVDIGKCNVNDGFEYYLELGQAVDSLDFLAGKEPVECLPLNTDTFELAFTPQSGVDYKWTIEGSWGATVDVNDITGSSATFLPDDSDASIIITAEGCETKIFRYRITRSLSDSNYIVGDTCLPANTPHQFGINNLTGGVAMNWSVTGAGWSIDAGQKTLTDPTINVGSGTGQIIVSTINCPDQADTLTVFIQPETPGLITGDTCIPANDLSALVYSVSSVANANSYQWFYPSTWSVTGSANNLSITLNPDGSTVGKVGVIAIGCIETDTSYVNIGFSSTIPDSILISDTCILSGGLDSVIFSVQTPIGGLIYEWDIPSQLGSILNYQSTTDSSEVQVETSGIDGNYIVRVRSKGSCDISDWDSLTVTIAGLNVAIKYTKNAFPGYSQFEVDPNPTVGATFYEWFRNGVPGISGATQTLYLVPNTQLPATICVKVTSSSGCVTTKCFVATYPTPPSPASGSSLGNNGSSLNSINAATNSLQVFPNPVKNQLNLQFGQIGTYNVVLINNIGQVVYQRQVSNVNQDQIDLSSYANGTYVVGIISTTGFRDTQTIIVSK